ncbi:MAG: alanine--glyoxylate aminotransferase family protein [Chloroflexi bacterium]|nr:alanine--glyoxylate aminotransferase family protein [Chloroflexota bacterium]
MSDTTNLRIPGPTSLPQSVREAGSRQMVNHRGPEFKALLGRVTAGLQRGFRTTDDVLILTASGTGALEACIVNFLSPGDPVLAVSIGEFGERFAAIARAFGADVTKLDVEPGRAAEPTAVAEALQAMATAGRAPRAVLLTHNETSTGVTNPLASIAAAVHETAPDALLIVDGISGLGALPFETDGWGLDVVATGSQKSWMVPPGLAMVSVSERAWAASETATMPRYYFDLRAARTSADKGETPWTPAVGICFALDAALEAIEAEGYEAIFARHAAVGAATRAGLAAMGFELFADPAHASDTVTSVRMPPGADWTAFSRELRSRGLVVAGAQGRLAGSVFRIGHLGDVQVDDILRALETIEAGSLALGIPVTRGVAVEAARAAAAAAGRQLVGSGAV